jgi:hypothetical protein
MKQGLEFLKSVMKEHPKAWYDSVYMSWNWHIIKALIELEDMIKELETDKENHPDRKQ